MKTPLVWKSIAALATILVAAATMRAETATALELNPLAEKKTPALPVNHAFEKGEPGEHGGPYTLKVTNTSNATLKVGATILQSVVSHNRPKTIDLPARTLAAGESWSINDLAVADKVTLSAEGFEKLEVTVPPSKAEKK